MSPDNFRTELASYVISRMSGSSDLDLMVKNRPSKRFILGSLAPQRYVENEQEKFYDEYTTEKASIKATRFRVSVLVPLEAMKEKKELKIQLTGNVFYKIRASEINDQEDQEEAPNEIRTSNAGRKYIWKRRGFQFDIKAALSQSNSEEISSINFNDFIAQCNKDPDIQFRLPEDTWTAEIRTIMESFDDNSKILHFYFANLSVNNPESDVNLEKALFDCKLLIDLNGLKTIQFVDNYKYNRFREKYFYDFRTINCQARFLNEHVRDKVITDHYLLFEQDAAEPISSSNKLNLSFEHLMGEGWQETLELVAELMNSIHSKYHDQLSKLKGELMPRFGNRQAERGEFERSIKNFDTLMNQFKRGLDYLLKDEQARIAFLAMNKVFFRYYKNKLGENYSADKAAWRLFQIVFLVSAIRSIAGKEDLDVVDVLHVATGGGKSEAYFALTVFSMFFERIEGKERGVTAIVKFPLRMLSIQQLERLASITIYAELVRKEEITAFKGFEFTLGYYVGNSDDFPDLYSKLRKELYEDSRMTIEKKIGQRSKVLTQCPLCAEGERGEIVLLDDFDHKRILHQCTKNDSHRFQIYYSDREVFRFRPTVVVSTVDKWAALSHQRRVRSLLGGNGSMCPRGHGFIPSGDKCEDKKEEGECEEIGENLKDVPGPILSIQDEMHLLKESFGTISSHFEGLIERLVSENSSGRGLKHIAMSATLNGIEDQIKELYNKNSFVISGESTSFSNPLFELFFKKESTPKRLIYGMKPNMRDNHYATLRTILHLIEFLDKEQKSYLKSPSEFLTKFGLESSEEATQIFEDFLTPLTYHLKKQDAEDMFRFTDAVINDPLERYEKTKVRGIVLTGDRGIDELKSAIDKVRDKVKHYSVEEQTDGQGTYNPLFATSVVSHGVDLEELNIMTFQGIPFTTSEYIQALSRVGRRRQGIVLVWLYPNRVRDGSFYKNFKRYHESLDHEVMPIPIKRDSRLGIKQTLNSVFCAGIIQYISNLKGTPVIHKKDVVRLAPEDVSKLIDFIKSSYGTIVDVNIDLETEERLKQIRLSRDPDSQYFPNILSATMDYYYRNQTGMRGIQENLTLSPNPRTRSLLQELNEVA